jgi:hypothetical protein
MPSQDHHRPRPADWISSGAVDEAASCLIEEVLRRSTKAAGAANTALWLIREDTLAAVIGTGPHAEHFVGKYEQALQRGIIMPRLRIRTGHLRF